MVLSLFTRTLFFYFSFLLFSLFLALCSFSVLLGGQPSGCGAAAPGSDSTVADGGLLHAEPFLAGLSGSLSLMSRSSLCLIFSVLSPFSVHCVLFKKRTRAPFSFSFFKLINLILTFLFFYFFPLLHPLAVLPQTCIVCFSSFSFF